MQVLTSSDPGIEMTAGGVAHVLEGQAGRQARLGPFLAKLEGLKARAVAQQKSDLKRPLVGFLPVSLHLGACVEASSWPTCPPCPSPAYMSPSQVARVTCGHGW